MDIENIFKLNSYRLANIQDIFISFINSCHDFNKKKTIYILIPRTTSSDFYFFCTRLFIYLSDDYNVKIINNLDNISKSDTVIATDIETHILLYESQVYNLLDNKNLFYKHIKDNYSDNTDDIYLIPTYNYNYQGNNFCSKFIIKPFTGIGSKNILFEEGFIYDIISKYSNNNQIQDIIQISQTYNVNLSCRDGKIIGVFGLKHNNPQIKTADYIFGFESNYIDRLPKNIFDFCEKIIKNYSYNGFINFEFIQDHTGKIYIMECNPRISGGIENPLYFKYLIEPYLSINSKLVDNMIKSGYVCNKVKRFDHFDFCVEYVKYKFGSLI
jgi:predicted ATP-grasp superfamily ATP-dependent carboligase